MDDGERYDKGESLVAPEWQGKFVACAQHGDLLVSHVDAYPEGMLQAQLNRIEAKLDRLLQHTNAPPP